MLRHLCTCIYGQHLCSFVFLYADALDDFGDQISFTVFVGDELFCQSVRDVQSFHFLAWSNISTYLIIVRKFFLQNFENSAL